MRPIHALFILLFCINWNLQAGFKQWLKRICCCTCREADAIDYISTFDDGVLALEGVGADGELRRVSVPVSPEDEARVREMDFVLARVNKALAGEAIPLTKTTFFTL